MQIHIERPSKTSVDIHVTLEAPEVDKVYRQILRTVRGSAQIPGFRPGKAPRAIVERRFADLLQAQTADKLVEDFVPQALDEAKVSAVQPPRVDLSPSGVTSGSPLSFHILCEVLPDLDPVGYKDLDLERPEIEVNEDEIAKLISEVQKKFAEAVPSEDRPVEIGDRVSFHFWGQAGDDSVSEDEPIRRDVLLGDDNLLPQFSDGLVGAELGKPVGVDFSYPEDLGEERLAGREAHFTLVVDAIHEVEYPEVDDDLARNAGFDNLEALRDEIRKDLLAQKEQEARGALLEKLFDALIERNRFEVPDGLVADYARSMMRAFLHGTMRGLGAEDAARSLPEPDEETLRHAQRRVKIDHLLTAIQEKEGIEVGEDDVDLGIRLEAKRLGAPLPKIRARYTGNEDALDRLRDRIQREKTLRLLLGEPEPTLEDDEDPAETPAAETPAGSPPEISEEPAADPETTANAEASE